MLVELICFLIVALNMFLMYKVLDILIKILSFAKGPKYFIVSALVFLLGILSIEILLVVMLYVDYIFYGFFDVFVLKLRMIISVFIVLHLLFVMFALIHTSRILRIHIFYPSIALLIIAIPSLLLSRKVSKRLSMLMLSEFIFTMLFLVSFFLQNTMVFLMAIVVRDILMIISIR